MLELVSRQVPGRFTTNGVCCPDDQNTGYENILWFSEKDDSKKKSYIRRRITKKLKEQPQLEHIIVALLRKDPGERMSVEEAWRELAKIGKLSVPAPGVQGNQCRII
ncbi:MAG: hypothetical protein ACR2PT_10765 [Endozoicomonas sp.]